MHSSVNHCLNWKLWAKKYYNCLAFNKCIRFSLSSGGPPLDPGYSQSKSRPSKPRVRRYWMVVLTNSSRLSLVDAMVLIGAFPSVQPPMANRVFSFGFFFLRSFILAYLYDRTAKSWLYGWLTYYNLYFLGLTLY